MVVLCFGVGLNLNVPCELVIICAYCAGDFGH